MGPNDIREYRVVDRHAGIPLDLIEPLSERAWTLVARSSENKLLHREYLTIAGAVEFLRGFEYHAQRYRSLVEALATSESTLLESLSPEKRPSNQHIDHEAVAYINRLGQFYYFATSRLVLSVIPKPKLRIKRITELMIFRNKHSAHRSVDWPKEGDTPENRPYQAMSMCCSLGATTWLMNEPKRPVDGKVPMWKQAVRQYQISSGNTWMDFVVERDHPIVIGEAYVLFQDLLTSGSA